MKRTLLNQWLLLAIAGTSSSIWADDAAPAAQTTAVQQCWNLGVGIDTDKAAAELLAFLDADQPSIVLSAGVTHRQQFLQHHCHFDAVGRPQ